MSCGEGAGFSGEEAGDGLEAAEDVAGAGGVELIGCDAAEDAGGGEQGGRAVFDEGELEGLPGIDGAVLTVGRGWAAAEVMVVAEGLVAEGGRTAAVAVGEEVAAAEAAGGVGGECVFRGFPWTWGGSEDTKVLF